MMREGGACFLLLVAGFLFLLLEEGLKGLVFFACGVVGLAWFGLVFDWACSAWFCSAWFCSAWFWFRVCFLCLVLSFLRLGLRR